MSAGKAQWRVAILAFDGVEALDFAGPFEVFTTATRMHQRADASASPLFEVLSVADVPDTRQAVQARAGLRLLVDHTLTDCPACDVLVVPGGVVDAPLASPAVLRWIATRSKTAQITASVCTGAFLLAASGVVANEQVTTHWEDLADLRTAFPSLQVLHDRRWVDLGRIVTSAGISAGIDMSLHLVERLNGRALAERTARQMDFTWTHNPLTPAREAAPIRVVFALLPDSLVLDWAGPAEALRIANQLLISSGRAPRFAIEFASPTASARGSVGITLSGLMPLPTTWDGPGWVVLVGLPGRTIAVDNAETKALLHWLRGLRFEAERLELVTVCAGSVLAAHAGALAGRRATTHHHHLDELRQVEPRCEVVANRVFVLDAPVYSSAGVTTGIDLVLHRIAETCGEALAAQVAQTMVVALRRGPNDPELSPFLAYRNHLHAALHRVQDAVSEQPQADWNVPRMAEVAHTSPRHLTRLFVEHAGVAPLAYLRRLRLASAQLALQSGANVTRAAELSGFGSDTQLRRAWHQFGLAGSPSAGQARALHGAVSE